MSELLHRHACMPCVRLTVHRDVVNPVDDETIAKFKGLATLQGYLEWATSIQSTS